MATFAPETLLALGRYWTDGGGVNLGIVGDTDHAAKGYSYHLGKGQLVSTAYSIKTARDKAGLSEAASAIDLGRLAGSLDDLRAFSVWLVGQARTNKPGTSDLREIIYSPDGTTVWRWDRERGFDSLPQTGEADDSHLTHTHISWYRDAEMRDHTTAFRGYFVRYIQASGLAAAPSGKLLRLPQGTPLYGFDGVRILATGSAGDWPYVGLADGKGTSKVIVYPTAKTYPDGVSRPTLLVAKTGTLVPLPVVVIPPPDPVKYPVTVGGKAVGEVELP